jgi:hypothetical protein
VGLVSDRILRRTTCTVPGHGTSCEPSQERDNRHSRCTEEQQALSLELAANACQYCETPFDPVRYRWLCPYCHGKNTCCE